MLMNRKIHGISLYRTMYFLPVVTSAVAAALVWQMIYGRDTGLLNFLLGKLGIPAVCWTCTSNALTSVVIVNIWGAIGEGMIIFLAGLQAIPRDYYEAATVDGADDWQRFWKITIPLITPSIFFQTLISTINAFQAYDYIYMLTASWSGGQLGAGGGFLHLSKCIPLSAYGRGQCSGDPTGGYRLPADGFLFLAGKAFCSV